MGHIFFVAPKESMDKKSLNKTVMVLCMYSDPRVVTIEHTREMPLLYILCFILISKNALIMVHHIY